MIGESTKPVVPVKNPSSTDIRGCFWDDTADSFKFNPDLVSRESPSVKSRAICANTMLHHETCSDGYWNNGEGLSG